MSERDKADRRGSTTSPATPPRPRTRIVQVLRNVSALTAALFLTLLAGLPAMFASMFLGMELPIFLAQNLGLDYYTALVFGTGISVGVGSILIIAAAIGTPILWARISNPSTLRLVAYLTIQQVAIGTGMLAPVDWPGWYITWVLAGFGTAAWWAWQQRWRGTGVAPSPLAGILRPDIHPGQIWFAVIAGRKETKVRPVLVLNPDPNNPARWLVAYFTTQAPKFDYLDQLYVQVPSGALRGLPKDNWVSMTDTRALNRNQFRVYTGLAPTWLYQAVCEGHKVAPNPLAWTIDETAAGHGESPFQTALLHALNIHHGTLHSDSGWNALAAIMKLPVTVRAPHAKKTDANDDDADTGARPSDPK